MADRKINTGLTEAEVHAAFYRALHDLTDEQITQLLSAERVSRQQGDAALENDLARLDAACSAVQAALTGEINGGAKNLMQLTGENVTGYGVSCVFDPDAGTITLNGVNPDKKCTGSFNVQVADPVNMALTAGKAYHFMCDGTSNDTYGIYIYKSGATPMTQWDCFTNTDADWNPVWSTSNGFRLFVRSGTVVDNVVLRPMICTAEDWALSEQFVPFCPSLPALYRMIQAQYRRTEGANA